jgi:hypothetical protein
MNFLLFLFTVFLLSLSPIASSDNSSAQGGNGFGGDGGTAFGGSSSSISQGGNGFGGMGGQGGAGGLGGDGGAGGTGYGIGGAGGIGTGTGGNASNSQSLHFDQVRQSPAVFMGAPMATAPCQASMGGFLSFIGGIGLAGSRTLEECEIRESARISHAIGQPKMAKQIICMGKYASQTRECESD